MLTTFADISEAKKMLHFQPKINLRTGKILLVDFGLHVASGIKLFVEWFKSYHGSKINSEGGRAKLELDTKLLNQEIDERNKLFHKRIGLLRDK